MPKSVVLTSTFRHVQCVIHIRILVIRRSRNWPSVTHTFAIPYTRGVGQRGVGELGARDARLRECAGDWGTRVLMDQRLVVAPHGGPIKVEALFGPSSEIYSMYEQAKMAV
jgi:hypothetical protein